MSDQTQPTDLVVRGPQRLQRTWDLLPGSLGEAREVATMIASSAFAPKDYKNDPVAVLIAIQMGADVGLRPLQALQNIAVINGRPSIWGDAALALVMPALADFNESFEGTKGTDDWTAVCAAHRKGWSKPTVRRFSVADAKAAKLWGKTGHNGSPTPWVTYPDRMLQLRARGFTLRDVGADLLMGLVLAEEASDYDDSLEPRHVGSSSVTDEGPEVAALLKLPEGLQERIEKGFEACLLTKGKKTAAMKQFLLAPGDLEEQAGLLLSWLEDEYAKRKTGKPVERKKDPNGKPRSAADLGSTATTSATDQSGAAGSDDDGARLSRTDSAASLPPTSAASTASGGPAKPTGLGSPTLTPAETAKKPTLDLF